MRNKGKMTAT